MPPETRDAIGKTQDAVPSCRVEEKTKRGRFLHLPRFRFSSGDRPALARVPRLRGRVRRWRGHLRISAGRRRRHRRRRNLGRLDGSGRRSGGRWRCLRRCGWRCQGRGGRCRSSRSCRRQQERWRHLHHPWGARWNRRRCGGRLLRTGRYDKRKAQDPDNPEPRHIDTMPHELPPSHRQTGREYTISRGFLQDIPHACSTFRPTISEPSH